MFEIGSRESFVRKLFRLPSFLRNSNGRVKDANLDSVVAVNRATKVRDYLARGTARG